MVPFMGITIGYEKEVSGGIEYRNCKIPDEAWEMLDFFNVRMYIWEIDDE